MNNNDDKKINLISQTEKNQNRESAEIQQINAISELKPNKNFIRKMPNDERNSPKKIFTNKLPNQQHQQAQATLLNKSISPRIQKTVTSLLNSSSGNHLQKSKPNINRSSKSPIKNRRRKQWRRAGSKSGETNLKINKVKLKLKFKSIFKFCEFIDYFF
jgi:hypothetical protein